jgi:hypothetical protein
VGITEGMLCSKVEMCKIFTLGCKMFSPLHSRLLAMLQFATYTRRIPIYLRIVKGPGLCGITAVIICILYSSLLGLEPIPYSVYTIGDGKLRTQVHNVTTYPLSKV